MQNWTHIKTKKELRKQYFRYLPDLQKIAMRHGYALAVHGSVWRDLDLIAVPWVPKAMAPETLVMALEYAMTEYNRPRSYWKKHSVVPLKPHGRRAYGIAIANLASDFEGMSCGFPQRHAIIDLSIMPRQ